MTERNESRQQAIALHLARVMGLRITEGRNALFFEDRETHYGYPAEWEPRHDRAQCMEVIEWAAVNGYGPTQEDTYCAAFNDQVKQFKASHDNTPAGVRAAALEAIALATGFEEN